MLQHLGQLAAPRSIMLPAEHYAATWDPHIHYTPAALTDMGKKFARLPEGERKQQKLLELCQAFHGYLTKYMAMVIQGHLPFRGGEVNPDARLLLQCFIPGQSLSKVSLGQACRTLHLAFKGMDTGEVYDSLIFCLIKAISRYDPDYHKKVQWVAKAIDKEFHAKRHIDIKNLSETIGEPGYSVDDCTRFLRLLSKHGFLAPIAEGANQVVAYRRTAAWPPPGSFFQSGSVGVSYFVTKWFRYFLVDWIKARMGEIEAKEDVLQLDHRLAGDFLLPDQYGEYQRDPAVPHSFGGFTSAKTGRSVAADMTLTKTPFDVSVLTLDWVNHTSDGLFGDLSRADRHLLFCIFSREMDWADVAVTFDVSIRDIKRRYLGILDRLRQKTRVQARAA